MDDDVGMEKDGAGENRDPDDPWDDGPWAWRDWLLVLVIVAVSVWLLATSGIR